MKAREFWTITEFTQSGEPCRENTLYDEEPDAEYLSGYLNPKVSRVREVLPNDELSALRSQVLKYEEALTSIAFLDEPDATSCEYWLNSKDLCEVVANDTIIARTVLAEFGKKG